MSISILALPGSLRKNSYNRRLLEEMGRAVPEGVKWEIYSLQEIPLYNWDVEVQGLPEEVVRLREAIREAQGIVIATPEYNYSIPGVLKNAIDWASRPPQQPFRGKPVGIAGASTGRFGTVRAQSHLRYVLQGLGALVMPTPELMVSQAEEKWDGEGRLSDPSTQALVVKFITAFIDWVKRLS